MPGFTIEQVPNEPIILISSHADWDTVRDTDVALAIVQQMLGAVHSPIFYIVDLTIEPRFNLDDLMFVAQRLTRGPYTVLMHPNVRELVCVTRTPVMQRALTAMTGPVRVRNFNTLDEALAYVRSQSKGCDPSKNPGILG